jgi:hypothetical protein
MSKKTKKNTKKKCGFEGVLGLFVEVMSLSPLSNTVVPLP